MSLWRYILLAGAVLVFLPGPDGGSLEARPFLKIKKIDTQHFPEVEVQVEVSNFFYQPFSGLGEEDFELRENGWRVGYLQSAALDQAYTGRDIVLLMGAGTFIHQSRFEKAKQAAAYLLDSLGERDRAAFITYGDGAPFLHSNFTEQQAGIKGKLIGLKREGKKNNLYDAAFYGLKLLEAVPNKRRALVIFAGGGDSASSMQADDVIALAGKHQVPIYLVYTGSGKVVKTKKGTVVKYPQSQKPLARLARKTGGDFIDEPSPDKIVRLFSLIGNLLEYRYLLKYRSLLPDLEKEQLKAFEAGDRPDHYNLDIEVRFRKDGLSDKDRSTGMVEFTPGWLGFLDGDLFLFTAALIMVLLLLVVILIIVRKDKLEFKVTPTEERILRRTLEANHEDRFINDFNTAAAQQAEINPEDPPGPAYSGAFLQEREGHLTGRKIQLYWESTVIGSDPDATIVVDDRLVSAKHCKIKRVKGKYILFDLVSQNGVYLNEKKLLRPRVVRDFDEIRIGHTVFLFRGRYTAGGGAAAPAGNHARNRH